MYSHFTSMVFVMFLFLCVAIHLYCPESSGVILKMVSEADPLPFVVLFSFFLFKFLLESDLIQLIEDAMKLSALQVRLRVAPFFTTVLPLIFSSWRSKKKCARKMKKQMNDDLNKSESDVGFLDGILAQHVRGPWDLE